LENDACGVRELREIIFFHRKTLKKRPKITKINDLQF